MTQAKLLLAITVITLLVVSGLFIPTEIEVFGQEQLEHSTNKTSSFNAVTQEPPTSTSANQSSLGRFF